MFKKPSKKMYNVIIFTVVSFLVFILLHLFVGRAIMKYSNRLKAEFKIRESKLRESEALIKALPDPKKAIEEIEKKAEEFKEMGVSRKQLPRLVQLLGRSTSEHNINVISIKPREDIRTADESLPAGVAKVYIELVVVGSFQALGDYMKVLSTLPTPFSIEALTIEKKEASQSQLFEAKKGAEAKPAENDLICSLLLSTYMIWEL